MAVRKDELLQVLAGVLARRPYSALDVSPSSAVPAAVLVIIHYHDQRPHVFLTKRGAGLRSHGGEISFPGGRFAQGDDKSLMDTALRETEEEVGIAFKQSDVLGSLEPVRTMTSNHFIVPFVTVQDMLPQVRVQATEVAEILDVPLVETLGTRRPDTEHFRFSKNAYRFEYNGNVIWGATARILDQLHRMLFAGVSRV
ncbi:CoA pyrophosphatase [Nitrososphaera sp.]|uniref:NUDIX hydrolase n=1 Tax=Nitrososphaera sp. TaxID=1971748 RepID=UPI00307E7E92